MSDKVILFGGSFDPPHLGHLLLGEWAAEILGAGVRFLPNGTPPHKEPHSSREDRLQMLRLAISDNSRFAIDETELYAKTYQYTVDTLRRHHKEGVGRDELFFVLGSDALNSLKTWREPEEIIRLCTLLVFQREPLSAPLVASLREQGAKIITAHAPIVEISSSLVRERVRQGKSIQYLVPDAVREYILKTRLYKEGKS